MEQKHLKQLIHKIIKNKKNIQGKRYYKLEKIKVKSLKKNRNQRNKKNNNNNNKKKI